VNILFVASEVAPYSKSGGLGDVAHSLPSALAARGHQIRVVTPLYATAKVSGAQDSGHALRLRFPYGEEQGRVRVLEPHPGHAVWFLDHPGLYGRSGLYGDGRGDFRDNHRRFAFLSVGALVAAQALGFQPDVVHFQGTSLGGAGCLFTIHNLAYQGLFPKSVMAELGLPWSAFTAGGLEFYDQVNFMKAGIAFADAINTVSQTYAREIQTVEYGCMLEGILRARADRLHGILNGIDVREWDPRRDPSIPGHFDADDLAGKAVCKAELRRRFGFPDPERLSRRPLFGVVSRLAAQKGIALLLESIPWLASQGAEVVVLGTGERWYEDGFRSLAARWPRQVGVFIGFDTPLAHLVEAGADFFLMPSQYEPCGLNQMYSLRYGTVPIVRATGGLEDTVRDADRPEGTGFKFGGFDGFALRWAIDRALRWWWERPLALEAMRRRGMAQDWSWEASARKYERLYASLSRD
jgi:starch synthase